MMHEEFYVYILRCSDNSYYVGHTDDISRRHGEHAEKIVGVNSYVSTRLPAKLVYVEYTQTRDSAKYAERMIKGWTRQKKEALIKGGWEAVAQLCRKLKHEKRLKKIEIAAGYKDNPSTAGFDSPSAHSALAQGDRGGKSNAINIISFPSAFSPERSASEVEGSGKSERGKSDNDVINANTNLISSLITFLNRNKKQI